MKTIWLINPYGPIEGENWREYSFNQFGKFLSENGYKVIWWTANFSHHFKKYRSNGWKDVIVNSNFVIRLVPTSSYKKNFGIGRMYKDYIFGKNAMRRFKQETPPHLIISAENPITMGNPSYNYAKREKVPMIYDQMDIWPEFIVRSLRNPFNVIANFLFKPVYRKRKVIYDNLAGSIALGKHYLEFMQHISPSLCEKPNALVYNGIDVKEFRERLNNDIRIDELQEKMEDEIWCVFAGTLGPSYDITGIIECAKNFNEDKKNKFKFIIAGSGPYEEMVINYSKKLENLIYLGKLLPEQLIPIYGRCDVGLSAYSAGSNVDMCDKFYDYTAAGLAVINSLKGEISEHIEEKKLGYNYKANDVQSFKKALMKIGNEEILNNAKRNSWTIGSEFDKNVQNKKLLEVINRII